ncbi:TetR/AcrR family transcriptional regulator [Nonomuraea sp. KC401]|uniref:TetR/AcrR family transcriptional regulator n=1 Tax=unclassified Nonomuraea TaxID=2593643 RepID=UPI0010FF33E0|nr:MULTISPECIES: TetR/AcrR family transcriptional regulator [unclassified Nonomuraea]NBE93226.1 TetR family transcriptional regulator [Nonomuraea sp. K271]TLF78030.1 TetR/AcrR family transcriptional regulator [Nonomuraea sp. KC401]
MPRTAEQNAALRAATREVIQTAAVRVFARRGFAASTIRDIALEADVSVGSIYRHYATKDELYFDLLDQAVAGLVTLAADISGPGRPSALVRAFTTRFLAGVTADDGAAEFVVVVNHGVTTDTPPGTVDRIVGAHRSMWRAFEELVRRGQAAGEFGSGDPAEITACYFATLGGLTTMRLALGAELAVPDVDIVLRLLTKGMSE